MSRSQPEDYHNFKRNFGSDFGIEYRKRMLIKVISLLKCDCHSFIYAACTRREGMLLRLPLLHMVLNWNYSRNVSSRHYFWVVISTS